MSINAETNPVKVGIAARLRAERERLGLTQTQLAAQLGLTRFTIANYESAARMPTADQLHAFGSLGADAAYVLTGTPAITSVEGLDRLVKTAQGIRDYCRLSGFSVSEEQILRAAIHFIEGAHPAKAGPERDLLTKIGNLAIQQLISTQ